jgi:hypothetical protein
MPNWIGGWVGSIGVSLALAGNLPAQQADGESQQLTLVGLRKIALYARVQLSDSAMLQRVDESALRTRMERALQETGISVVWDHEVRDGAEANLSLLYLVVETRDQTGRKTGFAASSCLQAAQIVRIPRLTTPKHIAYTVVPTWRSCGLLVGDAAAYPATILRNADEQLARFLEAWRSVNVPPKPAGSLASPELGMVFPR